MANNDKELTILEHLAELRSSLVKAGIAVLVTSTLSMIFAERVLNLLILPLGEQIPQTIKPTESFTVYFKVALICGLGVAMPVVLYQAVRFILPGLLPHERKYLTWLLPGATFSFIAGGAFGAFVMIPVAVNFMQGFLETIVDNRWTLENYVDFVTRVMFWMGVVFETPLILFFLAKVGVVDAKKLARWRKFAFLGCAVVAAMITPTPDPVNMMIVMLPLYGLYEVGILLTRLARSPRKPTVEVDTTDATGS
jgi:sec-independent protein translocase protein TatC